MGVSGRRQTQNLPELAGCLSAADTVFQLGLSRQGIQEKFDRTSR